MSATNLFENGIALLYFNNVALGNVGDVSGLQPSATAGSIYVSLHTADPTETGNQTSQEAAYTSYARQPVARSGAGWTVTNDTAENASAITFPQATGGSETETHFGLGSSLSGTGQLDLIGTLNSALAVSTGITPEFAAGALDVVVA